MNTKPASHTPATIESLSRMIGNTPLVAIDFLYRGRKRVIHAKCEYFNLTGSIKDRMALHILRRAYESGQLLPGDRIIEASSGNAGISFAALGAALGHQVAIFMPDWMSMERTQILRGYGAEVIPVSREQGGFVGAIQTAEQMAASEPHVFPPRQFSNDVNIEAHATTTGPEILLQLEEAGLEPQAFVAGVGTGGTVMGVGRFLREKKPDVRIHAVEPAESPTLSVGRKLGKHRIQGMCDDFVPAIVNLAQLDPVIAVSDGDSILMAQKLAARLGLGVGISSGCNFLAAVSAQESLGGDAVVVTVFADDNKKYLTTDLLREEPVKPGYVSPELELTGVRVLSHHCRAFGGLS